MVSGVQGAGGVVVVGMVVVIGRGLVEREDKVLGAKAEVVLDELGNAGYAAKVDAADADGQVDGALFAEGDGGSAGVRGASSSDGVGMVGNEEVEVAVVRGMEGDFGGGL